MTASAMADDPMAAAVDVSMDASSMDVSDGAAKTTEQEIREHKDTGNAHFVAKRYQEAVECYRAGLSLSPPVELEISLRTNLAQALLRLAHYQEAEQECTSALKLDPSNAKAWFRRALAREHLNKMQEALLDVQASLRHLDSLPATTSSATRKQTLLVLKRLEQQCENENDADDMMTDAEQEQETTVHDEMTNGPQEETAVINGPQEPVSHATNGPKQQHETASGPPSPEATHKQNGAALGPSARPSPKQQRQDVMRLLLARKSTAEGEALFLLDWHWWTSWCKHVDFYYTGEKPQATTQHERILKLLPEGAVLPTTTSKDDDEDSSHSSSSSADSTDADEDCGPPHEIDNSALLLRETDVTHWRPHHGSDDNVPQLQSNLVRGHHYELIPREVYNALRIWYGEVTPSLCRRVVLNEQDVAKLPLYEVPPQDTLLPNKHKHTCGACRAPCSSNRCTQCLAVHYCNRICQNSHWPYHKAICKQAKNGLAEISYSDGRVGLHNLGNTCFMNSALQCLSHATPLTRHFLSDRFKNDLNTCNPLGSGGRLADAYETVLKDIWLKTNATSTSPTSLKRAIAMVAPRFAGCSQHDAQEFLAYLLDGLHEDLNRIKSPPYVEMPDFEQGNMAIAGAQAWDAHKRRNDSLVLDTFYGQFKSTCVCPKCNRTSVSFDAFNHVILEIPQFQNMTRVIPILLFRSSSGQEQPSLPVRYGVEVPRNSFTMDVRQALSDLSGIDPGRLAICDVYDSIIFEILKDPKPVSTIRNSDVLAAYEVDPYTDVTIHTIAMHALVDDSDDKKDVTTELEASAETTVDSMEAFGFPFVTSFDSQVTCKEVWEHVWKVVKNVVAPDFLSSFGQDRDECLRSLLRIRIVDNNGKPRCVFLEDVPNVLDDDAIDRASILPPLSDEKLMTYLGEDCAMRFLFIRLEWHSMAPDEEESKHNAPVIIDKERFLCYENHSSWEKALQKMRAANGAKKGVRLDQCFESFTKPERLDEHNMWYCSRCKEHVKAMKTMALWRLPNIMIVTLKRFEFRHMLRRDKLDTLVSFPIDGLDMSKHCASSQSSADPLVQDSVPAVYDLFAVLNHYGRMGFGHYTAFARQWDEQGMSNEWALFDDASVREVTDGNAVITSAAYVLFYRRRDFN